MAGWDNPMREFERLRVENAGLRAEVGRLRAGIEELCDPANDGLRPYAVALGRGVILAVDTDALRALLADRERP